MVQISGTFIERLDHVSSEGDHDSLDYFFMYLQVCMGAKYEHVRRSRSSSQLRRIGYREPSANSSKNSRRIILYGPLPALAAQH